MAKQIGLNVDSNCQRRACVSRYLEPLGLELHKAASRLSARQMVQKHHYRLILVYLDALGGETFDFCSSVRANAPAAILIAVMADSRLKVEERLFDCGVSDVVCGRHACARLLARRIKAHLSNCKPAALPADGIRVKDTLIDLDRREVWCNGTMRGLRGILADLLRYFLDNPNRVISRQELQHSSIWADSICSSPEEGGKTFDVNVGKLRKVIEPDPSNPQIIKSVRGVGWKLAADIVGSLPVSCAT